MPQWIIALLVIGGVMFVFGIAVTVYAMEERQANQFLGMGIPFMIIGFIIGMVGVGNWAHLPEGDPGCGNEGLANLMHLLERNQEKAVQIKVRTNGRVVISTLEKKIETYQETGDYDEVTPKDFNSNW